MFPNNPMFASRMYAQPFNVWNPLAGSIASPGQLPPFPLNAFPLPSPVFMQESPPPFQPDAVHIAGFITKLRNILDDETLKSIIRWKADNVIEITDTAKFVSEVLLKHFKHGNLASFVRQLNLYGFKKVLPNNHKDAGADHLVFRHDRFKKSAPDLLPYIHRKSSEKTRATENAYLQKLRSELYMVKESQKGVLRSLQTLNSTNEIMYQEMLMCSQRHHQHEVVINHLMKVLSAQGISLNGQQTEQTSQTHLGPSSPTLAAAQQQQPASFLPMEQAMYLPSQCVQPMYVSMPVAMGRKHDMEMPSTLDSLMAHKRQAIAEILDREEEGACSEEDSADGEYLSEEGGDS